MQGCFTAAVVTDFLEPPSTQAFGGRNKEYRGRHYFGTLNKFAHTSPRKTIITMDYDVRNPPSRPLTPTHPSTPACEPTHHLPTTHPTQPNPTQPNPTHPNPTKPNPNPTQPTPTQPNV